MKKQLTLPLLIFAGILLFSACKKDSKAPECNLNNAEGLTYTAHIKGIVDQYCISCHSGSGPGPGDYTTYEGLAPYLNDDKVLNTVVIDKSMPQGAVMPQTKIDSINCWIQNGHPK